MQAPGQVQQGSGEGSEGSNCLGTFGAEPGQVQQGSAEGSGKGLGGLWCRARLGSTGSQGRLQRKFPEKVPEVPGDFGAEPGQVQHGSGEGSGEGLGGFGAR